MPPTTETQTNEILNDVRRAIAVKIGGPEGTNIARAIEALAEQKIRGALLDVSPGWLDPIVDKVCDLAFPIIEQQLEAVIAQVTQRLGKEIETRLEAAFAPIEAKIKAALAPAQPSPSSSSAT